MDADPADPVNVARGPLAYVRVVNLVAHARDGSGSSSSCVSRETWS